MEEQLIGVVIATRNRAQDLCTTLEKLQQLPESLDIVVADNASIDGSPDVVAEQFPDVTLLRLPENLGAAARNAGVEMLTTPYVAFCDDDSWWTPGSLSRAASILDANPRVGLLAAKVLVGKGNRVDGTCDLMANSPLGQPSGLPGPRIMGFIACGAIVRREAFLQANGFDAHFGIGGEEDLLAMSMASAGWDLVYVDDVIVHHHPSPVRNRNARREILTRNHLWTTWLRRPLRVVTRTTVTALAGAATNSGARRGLIQAFRGLPWVSRQRQVLPLEVEQMVRLLSEA